MIVFSKFAELTFRRSLGPTDSRTVSQRRRRDCQREQFDRGSDGRSGLLWPRQFSERQRRSVHPRSLPTVGPGVRPSGIADHHLRRQRRTSSLLYRAAPTTSALQHDHHTAAWSTTGLWLTSVKEVMFSSAFVCLFVSRITQKVLSQPIFGLCLCGISGLSGGMHSTECRSSFSHRYEFITLDLRPPKNYDFNPVDYKIRGVIKQRVSQTKVQDMVETASDRCVVWRGLTYNQQRRRSSACIQARVWPFRIYTDVN